MKSKKRSLIQDLPTGLLLWWLGLCTVSVLNIGLLATLWMKHLKKSHIPNREAYAVQRRQLSLSTPFVLGCASRSFLPRADVQRITLVGSWLSSVLVGRTVATIAELRFVAQWANLLETFARPAKENRIMTFSKLLFPAITVAEVFSRRGLLTTDNF